MLRKETVEEGTMDLIERLMADKKLGSFILVGGTALALKIGHRKSINIDLFSEAAFDSQLLSKHLSTSFNVSRIQAINNGVFCLIDGIKVDLLTHKYPLVEKMEIVETVRLASLIDIGAMKLNAIYNNGTRLKDFVDLYFLLEVYSLQDLFLASEKKYVENDISMVSLALQHHEDIDFSVPIQYFKKVIKWELIAERIQKAVNNPGLKFIKTLSREEELLQKKHSIKPKRRGPRL